jgi:hypothetical protein
VKTCVITVNSQKKKRSRSASGAAQNAWGQNKAGKDPSIYEPAVPDLARPIAGAPRGQGVDQTIGEKRARCDWRMGSQDLTPSERVAIIYLAAPLTTKSTSPPVHSEQRKRLAQAMTAVSPP